MKCVLKSMPQRICTKMKHFGDPGNLKIYRFSCTFMLLSSAVEWRIGFKVQYLEFAEENPPFKKKVVSPLSSVCLPWSNMALLRSQCHGDTVLDTYMSRVGTCVVKCWQSLNQSMASWAPFLPLDSCVTSLWASIASFIKWPWAVCVHPGDYVYRRFP